MVGIDLLDYKTRSSDLDFGFY